MRLHAIRVCLVLIILTDAVIDALLRPVNPNIRGRYPGIVAEISSASHGRTRTTGTAEGCKDRLASLGYHWS